MNTAIQLAARYILSEVPWYFLACVPFLKQRRVSRTVIGLMAAFMIAFRAASAFVLVLAVPNWLNYTAYAYLLNYLLLITLFIRAFRVSAVRLFYVFLLMYSISTCINQIAYGSLFYLFPYKAAGVPRFTLLTVMQFAGSLIVMPFLYRFCKGSLQTALEQLDKKSILLLCVTPLTFAVIALAFVAYGDTKPVEDLSLNLLYLLVSLAGIISYFFNLKMLLNSAERLNKEHELETRLALQAKDYENLTQSIEAARAARHDLRHHLGAMRDFAGRNDTAGMLQYLDEYSASLPGDDVPDWCENRTVNALLKHYLAIAAGAGVHLDVKLDLPMGAGVPDTDLCVVFGNIFENAVNAAAGGEDAFIRARCVTGGDDIVLTVENSIGSAASHGEGLGLRNVEAAVKKSSGTARFEKKGSVYTSKVILRKVQQSGGRRR
ncbi:GHKL domain-containing protein [[Clostridium] hylemonae]|uniref:ATPase/histidine kinase/DNA gyrase B/HSP90 domain protein n=1 Tax=[Clostridium] hylemonae DSM 15053 TaxID=553973 RepID=C0BXK5_9FIRM|nr:GHKL domain-containing protein [[Clostridium] hylemonae]EEG75312.1 ATPase/histidine kinase/DNA gyrase B/HSP90 domain protein [[Clostridium] hylemonae DSM 15053]QEK17029.1 hypothetical protein LAJLEIBI_01038 [[Clostridium] hylemonae DSM 15053]